MDQVAKILAASDQARKCVVDTLAGSPIRGLKQVLVASYLDAALEYHEAITMLAAKELFGAAFTLMRPLYEACLRGLWVVSCASDREIESISRNVGFEFRQAKVLAIALDLKLNCSPRFASYHDDLWKVMNSYTHTGLRQLGRRGFRGARPHGYSKRSVIEAVDYSTSSLLQFCHVYFNNRAEPLKSFLVSMLDKAYFSNPDLTWAAFDAWRKLVNPKSKGETTPSTFPAETV